jgi:hypothetical protein
VTGRYGWWFIVGLVACCLLVLVDVLKATP